MTTTPEQAVIQAAQPILNEINRLEREYGFDRPMHQGQCLMLPLGELVAFRSAIERLAHSQPASERLREAYPGLPMSDADLTKHYEASKHDAVGLVGSEVRQLIGELRHWREHGQALRVIAQAASREVRTGFPTDRAQLEFIKNIAAATLGKEPFYIEWTGTEADQQRERMKACCARRADYPDDECEGDGSCSECGHDMAEALETEQSKERRAIRAALQPLTEPQRGRQEGELREALTNLLAAQQVQPYRGWNITALNKAADKARALLELPSVRELNPDIAAMQDIAAVVEVGK